MTDDEIVELVQALRKDPRANSLTILAAQAIEQLAEKADRTTECEERVRRLRSTIATAN